MHNGEALQQRSPSSTGYQKYTNRMCLFAPLYPLSLSQHIYQLAKFLAGLLAIVGQTSSSELQVLCRFHLHTGPSRRRDPGVIWWDILIHLRPNRPSSQYHPSFVERTILTVKDLVDLLTLCLNATFLSFRGKIYKQVHGTALGSPVSVVVANLVMEDSEQWALSTFHPPTRFWKR